MKTGRTTEWDITGQILRSPQTARTPQKPKIQGQCSDFHEKLN